MTRRPGTHSPLHDSRPDAHTHTKPVGDHDDLPEGAFYMKGDIAMVIESAQAMA